MRAIIILLLMFDASAFIYGQCSVINGAGCSCANFTNDCDMLPDITLSWYALSNYNSPIEYSQTGNGANDGRIRITASTPNIGYGSFTVLGSNYYLCGIDTFLGNPGICSDGSEPYQLLRQRIYHKTGSAISFWERWAGYRIYNQNHNHYHIPGWETFSLRIQDAGEPDPRKWSMVGNNGTKAAFCFADLAGCSNFYQHCLDDNTNYGQGNILIDTDFPNFGFTGEYSVDSCHSLTAIQGISSGYTDVYGSILDGMWINIPPGTCNGDYWIVAEVDPNDDFLESNENNNYTAIPVTLTLQDNPGNPKIKISYPKSPVFCTGEQIILSATAGYSYLWSTGGTTQNIFVNTPGPYWVTVNSPCGPAVSDTIFINELNIPPSPFVVNDTLCNAGSATLLATGTSFITWYDSLNNMVGTGPSFITPVINSTTTYYAHATDSFPGFSFFAGKPDSSGNGMYYVQPPQCMFFNAYLPATLLSVKVYASGSGYRTFKLKNSEGKLINHSTHFIPDGESRVVLNYDIPAGYDYALYAYGYPNLNLYGNYWVPDFPFKKKDTLSIYGSSDTISYSYFFFYDWELNIGRKICSSPLVPATAYVNNCTFVSSYSNGIKNLSLHPNPFNDLINISFDANKNSIVQVEVYDVFGKLKQVKSIRASGNKILKLDMKNLADGVYFVKISDGNSNYINQIVKIN